MSNRLILGLLMGHLGSACSSRALAGVAGDRDGESLHAS